MKVYVIQVPMLPTLLAFLLKTLTQCYLEKLPLVTIIEIARYLMTDENKLGHALVCKTYPLHQRCINYHCCLATI